MGIDCVAHSTSGVIAGGAGHDGAAHGPELTNPPRDDPRFLKGSTGPVVGKNEAPKLTIPDGEGFGGIKGRKQNDGDKAQNRYSTTDANFYPSLGLLPADPDTGKPMTYVQHIQAYNAVGYVQTFAPEVYARLVAQQNAGTGTVLGGALYLMGIVQKPDPAAQGLTPSQIPAQVPGTPLNAKQVVMSGKDITGQQWARPHHAESAWPVFKQLMDSGLDWKSSMILSGDDAISGSGRLNGFNNQDGKTGLNADERAAFRLGALVQQQTGINVIGIMAGGHSHTGLDDSAKTDPRVNKLIGLAKNDRSNSAERLALIYQGLLSGTVGGQQSTYNQLDKFVAKDKGAFTGVAGATGVIDQVRQADMLAHPEQAKQPEAAKPATVATAIPAAAIAQPTALPTALALAQQAPAVQQDVMSGGCMDAMSGVGLLGGPAPAEAMAMMTILQQLLSQLTALLTQLHAPGVQAAATAAAPAVTPQNGGASNQTLPNTTAVAAGAPPAAIAPPDVNTHAMA